MKNFILALFMIFSLNSFSQDSTTIANSELDRVFNAIDTLIYQDSIKAELIQDLNYQIKNYQFLVIQDSILVIYKDRQIDILNEQINLYDDRLKKVDKWYRKPWVGFVIGAATVTLSSWVV